MRVGNLIVLVLLSFALPAMAVEGPCAKAAAEKCMGMDWGKGLGMCLNRLPDLTPECKNELMKMKMQMKEKFTEAKNACQTDAEKYCSSVEKKAGYFKALKKCMEDHETELSDKCKEFRAHKKEKGLN